MRVAISKGMRGAGLALSFATPLAAADVPSGQQVTLHEVLVDPQAAATYLRFRFIVPAVARGDAQLPFDVAGADMLHLCDTLALPYIAQNALVGDKIVITFMDQYTEFGTFDPDTTQFIEGFRAEDGRCMWDGF